ncbi:MAG TPA: 4-hydroxybenzoate 3-monooxygenase [Pseudonocardiaceae bacterium]|nr:4-hydroxybenzoate 3-monooxygenase [Pseudonocardiaceae bacterium]
MKGPDVTRTQVGIVGAGPAGLLLARMLELAGIDSVVVENRDREYVRARQRAGVVEQRVADLLRDARVGDRLDRQGLVHDGIYVQFAGERHHVDFRELTGRTVTVYAQTEIVKDLMDAREASGLPLEFEVSDTTVSDVDGDLPVLSYVDKAGDRHRVECDMIAGCDGFHGISRAAVPGRQEWQRDFPYAWLGILADVPPSTDELIYARHDNGFALHSLRSPTVSRLYLQVAPDESLDNWPHDRIWAELATRFALPGWELKPGPVTDVSITPMRVFATTPMRHGNLFLAGDSAHIVPPTGAKGLNLALGDAAFLAKAMIASLRDGRRDLLDAYSATREQQVWRAVHFAVWMTEMLHVNQDADPMAAQLQLAQLRYVVTSRAMATSLAENYTGIPW